MPKEKNRFIGKTDEEWRIEAERPTDGAPYSIWLTLSLSALSILIWAGIINYLIWKLT